MKNSGNSFDDVNAASKAQDGIRSSASSLSACGCSWENGLSILRGICTLRIISSDFNRNPSRWFPSLISC